MTLPPQALWRVFPWDRTAKEGERGSATYIAPVQGKGRFDLGVVAGGVLYLAETAEHAVAERIQQYRGQELDEADLRVDGRTLGLASIRLPEALRTAIIDLCDPNELARLGVRPDQLASRDRHETQRIAAAIHAEGGGGLRWWSALSGDWHTVVVFSDRLTSPLEADEAEPLSLTHVAVVEAARTLGIRLLRR